jgi:hypothetical protein
VVWKATPEQVRVLYPVDPQRLVDCLFLSTTGHAKSCGKLGGPPSKANYLWPPIANEYREGKVKSTPQGE